MCSYGNIEKLQSSNSVAIALAEDWLVCSSATVVLGDGGGTRQWSQSGGGESTRPALLFVQLARALKRNFPMPPEKFRRYYYHYRLVPHIICLQYNSHNL